MPEALWGQSQYGAGQSGWFGMGDWNVGGIHPLGVNATQSLELLVIIIRSR